MIRKSIVSDAVTVTIEQAVAVITLNSPEQRNMISPALTGGLVAACRTVGSDATVACAVLTANGRVFSAGGNIKNMYRRADHFAGNAAEIRQSYANGVQQIARAMHSLDVPVIAAVNGAAIGAGLDIAMMCDIRIAAEEASFAESFIKLGLVSAAGGAWFLTRAIGGSAAAEMTLTGDTVDARRALALGIVSRVVAADQLMPTAMEIARRIARHPPQSVRLNTRLLRESARLDLWTSLELAANMQAIVQQTEDQHEAVAAVVEKREPVFKGR